MAKKLFKSSQISKKRNALIQCKTNFSFKQLINFRIRNEVMDLFSTPHGSDHTLWPKTFKHYYQTYDKVMKVLVLKRFNPQII